MKLPEASDCMNCQHVAQRVANLENELVQARECIAKLETEDDRPHEEVARLEQQLATGRKASSTSSKPPLSDIVKPKKTLPKSGKKGGQMGREQNLRSPGPGKGVVRSRYFSSLRRSWSLFQFLVQLPQVLHHGGCEVSLGTIREGRYVWLVPTLCKRRLRGQIHE